MNDQPEMKAPASHRFFVSPDAYNDINLKTERGSLIQSSSDSLDETSFTTLERYYPGASEILAAEVNNLQSLTNNTIGGVTVPTTKPVRMAVWHYVQLLYGINRDDYSYCAMNNFMPLHQKTFVKKMSCYPHRLTRNDFRRLLDTFNVDDIIHYSLIASQSRRIAELTFALHAVARAMCNPP